MRRVVLLAAFVTALSGRAHAGEEREALKQGAAEYAAQHYPEAAAAYRRAVDAGVHHPSLYYNLGNAYFRAGQLGPAILWYERALALDDDLSDAKYNLDVAREAVAARYGKDQVKGATSQAFWITAVHWLDLPLLLLVVLGLDLAFFGLLVALRFVPTGFVRTGLGVTAAFVLVAGLGSGSLLIGRLHYDARVKMSVVVADEVVMHELPDEHSREMPKLHAGHRVIILRESQGFYRVQLANHVEGWVPTDTVERI